MKRKQCKLWYECIDYYPALIPLDNMSRGKGLNLDFSNCSVIDSCGLTISLIKILNLLKNDSGDWIVDYPSLQDKNINIAKNIGFFNIINRYSPIENSLFTPKSILLTKYPSPSIINENFYKKTIFPIFMIDYSSFENRREANKGFKQWLFQIINPIGEDYHFLPNQLISILYEMSKNSADHTSENAFFGLDYLENKNFFELHFCFADLGNGIKQHIQENLPEKAAKRISKMALVDAYHFALTYGNTSKPDSKFNKGVGMTVIMDGSKGLDIDLSVFDAKSRGVLTNIGNTISHEKIRKVFLNIGNQTGFYYYGVLKRNLS